MQKKKLIHTLVIASALIVTVSLVVGILAHTSNAVSAPKEMPAASSFTDVSEKDYCFDAVRWADQESITNGTSATTFSPRQSCTRAQIVTFLWRAFSAPEISRASLPFVDVAEDSYYYQAVLWAQKNRITNGTDDTHFSPDQTCTRAQIVTLLWRALREPECTLTEEPFLDVAQEDYFFRPVLWAFETQITKGVSDDSFGPKNACTRAQVVTFLYRARDLLQQALREEPLPEDPSPGEPDHTEPEPLPEDPPDPDAPDEPTDPTSHWIPVDPTDPSGGEDPKEPTDPGAPNDPEDPTEPGSSGEPADPTEPGSSGEPADPTEPGLPDEPSEPTAPTIPTDLNQGTWVP